jgi:hypothetical protein
LFAYAAEISEDHTVEAPVLDVESDRVDTPLITVTPTDDAAVIQDELTVGDEAVEKSTGIEMKPMVQPSAEAVIESPAVSAESVVPMRTPDADLTADGTSAVSAEEVLPPVVVEAPNGLEKMTIEPLQTPTEAP